MNIIQTATSPLRKYLALAGALALVAALAFSHFTVYRKGVHDGKADVQHAWDVSVAEGNSEALRLERARQSRADQAARIAAAREAGLRAAADRARRESSGLRDAADLAERVAAESGAAAQQARRALRDVVGQCGARLAEVAADADLARSEARELREAWPH